MDISSIEREALDLVAKRGLEDGNEHLAIVRGDKIIEVIDGKSDRVELKDAIDRDAFKRGDILVHNHPNSYNSLSNMDLMLSRAVQARWIYAISQDGSVYRGRVKSGTIVDQTGPALFYLLLESANYSLLDRAEQAGIEGVFLEQGGNHLGPAHWINRMLARDGFIDYEFDLAPDSVRLIEEVDTAMKNAGGRHEQ